MHFIAFDIETGGFNSEVNTILEAYFAIYDKNFKLIEDLELLLVNDEGLANAEEEALKVTGINLEEHLKNPKTIKYSEGRKKLFDMLTRNKIEGKKRSFRALGQNIVYFDMPFIHRQKFIAEDEWKKYIHHNALDTTQITTFLKEIGMLPEHVGSLSSLAEHFGIANAGAHRAKNDVQMQVQIYQRLADAVKKNHIDKASSVSVNNSDLFKIIEM